MKRLALAASMLMISTLAAAAQSWNGGYVGAAGGYGSGHSDQTDPGIPAPLTATVPVESFDDGHYSTRGGALGGTLGYNSQTGPLVYGAEGDLSWANIHGQSNVCGPTTAMPHPCGTNLDALGTFRGRAGFAAGGNWLLYATGGLAIGELRGWDVLTPASGRYWRAGWTAGAGVEIALAPNWSAKLEYLRVDLGNGQVFNVVPGIAESVGFRADLVRAGFNYRFGGAGHEVSPPLYTKAPVLSAGNPWAGWYAGLNAGYLDGSTGISTSGLITSTSDFPANTAAMLAGATNQLSTGQGGFLGGVQTGYNYPISPAVLVGWEADIQVSSLRGRASATSVFTTTGFFGSDTLTATTAASRSLDYLGTVRARIGGLVTPGTLLYLTGGLAYGGIRSNTTVTEAFVTAFPPSPPANVNSGAFSDNRVGYTIGAGGEWMFFSNWSLKTEYLYYDLGSANYGTGISAFDAFRQLTNGIGIDAIATSSRVHFNGNIARIGLNYHL